MADATYTAVDLSRLPAPDIVEALDFETIVADAVARMTAAMAEAGLTYTARDSDPATKLLQVFAYFAQQVRQRINDAARAVMPAYATGADLENIAALFGVFKQTIVPADPASGTPAVMETDAEFRRRMVLAPEGYSVAGPTGAYLFHALSADPDVLDASVTSPAPGEVLVSILSRTGTGAAPPDLVATVSAYLTDETRRPLTDFVTVQSAEIVEYEIEATITTFSGPDEAVVLGISQSQAEAFAADNHRLARDVNRSAIFAALHTEGVQNVVLTSPPTDIIISDLQASHCSGVTIHYAGTGE